MPDNLTAAERFLSLHRPGDPLLLPNPWDRGSATLLEALGFQALATTSSGFAASLGRPDGQVSRDEALAHAGEIAAGATVPVNADLENGYGHEPSEVAETVLLAIEAGLAGCSVEDWSGREIYDLDRSAARVAAAAEAAHQGAHRLVLTARSENFLHGRKDRRETISRLQAYQEAGADVLFAPGLRETHDIEAVLRSVELPLNVLVVPGMAGVGELAALGVSRISVGGGFAYAAYAALLDAGTGFQAGSFEYLSPARRGASALHDAFAER